MVLWNDDDHTYAYVITMLLDLFDYPVEKGYQMAQEVDTQGRVVVLTTTMEHAELKRDQIHAYGKDALIANCRGSMSASIEPVEGQNPRCVNPFFGSIFALASRRPTCYTPPQLSARRPAVHGKPLRWRLGNVSMELAMIGKWAFRIAALAFVLSFLATAVCRADSLWSNLLAGNRVEADPAKPYTLKEEHGPLIIMACSFNGENAEEAAHDLVMELRKRYHVDAYVHNSRSNWTIPTATCSRCFALPIATSTRWSAKIRTAYRDGAIKEVAVVVGNFAAIDDPDAQQALKTLKAADPECLHVSGDESQSRSLGACGRCRPASIDPRKPHGPLAHAFITRNPLLPEDYFAPKGGVDDLVLKMNENVDHSLLDCPGKYTVQVAHFTGEVIINQTDIRAIESGIKAGPESTKQGLATAAEKAHTLTEALRSKGYEAYEFHDHDASLVTVGSFDSVGTPRPTARSKSTRGSTKSSRSFRAKTVKPARRSRVRWSQVVAGHLLRRPADSRGSAQTVDQPPIDAATRFGLESARSSGCGAGSGSGPSMLRLLVLGTGNRKKGQELARLLESGRPGASHTGRLLRRPRCGGRRRHVCRQRRAEGHAAGPAPRPMGAGRRQRADGRCLERGAGRATPPGTAAPRPRTTETTGSCSKPCATCRKRGGARGSSATSAWPIPAGVSEARAPPRAADGSFLC